MLKISVWRTKCFWMKIDIYLSIDVTPSHILVSSNTYDNELSGDSMKIYRVPS